MKVWASKKSIRAEIADVPEGWLDRFAVEQPGDIRKFGDMDYNQESQKH